MILTNRKTINMSKIKKCEQCKEVRGRKENHVCPLQEALNGKKETHCNCCSGCIKKCEKEINPAVDSIYDAINQANIGNY